LYIFQRFFLFNQEVLDQSDL